METENLQPVKGNKILRIIRRAFLILLLLIILLSGTAVMLAWIYGDEAKAYVVGELNKQLSTEVIVQPDDIDFSILRSFPNASVEFKNVAALDAIAGAKKDTLFKAGNVALRFNVMNLFNGDYTITEIGLEEVVLNLRIDK